MKLDEKGFTLIELMAVVVILGIIMVMTIPNIIGITNQNRITNYAEDAKKFKNSAEYMFRGDDTIEKPKQNGQCVMVNLKYLHNSEFDSPPYGGEYLMDYSYVIMKKENNRYVYYVQLLEKLPDGAGYKGFNLIEASQLEGNDYFDLLAEKTSLSGYLKMTGGMDLTTVSNHAQIKSVTNCTFIKIFYAA